MIVTEIEDCGSGKRKVYLDGQPAFVLYRGELSLCHIEKDQELPEAALSGDAWMRSSGNGSVCAVFTF